MESETEVLTGEAGGGASSRRLQIGVDVLTTSQVATQYKVAPRTVERWITKPRNALPALHVTEEQMRKMGYSGNLPSTTTGIYFLIRKSDLALIPSVRKYPKDRKSRVRKGTTTGAGAPERQP